MKVSPQNDSMVRSENKCRISSLNHEIVFYGRNVESDTDNMKEVEARSKRNFGNEIEDGKIYSGKFD